MRAFAFDPMTTRLTGQYLNVDVPFETDLGLGPSGRLVQVVDYDSTRNRWYQPVDLNDPAILAAGGLLPAEHDPRSHQQVVYAVTMSVLERFERFVGRRFRWRGKQRLRLVPHAFEGRNAYFDPDQGAVLFGYFAADEDNPGANLPGQVIFSCLSSDIVAHEVTHAILHRSRKYFREATNPDVFAWHEAFADLVTLFQHFVNPDIVRRAVAASKGDLREGTVLLELAQQFGAAVGRGAALRSAVNSTPDPQRFRQATEPHERGACFVASVFAAYNGAHRAAIADLIRIATGGSGVLPVGELSVDLVKRVAQEAVRLADIMLGMVVRALDYLPVVDVTFGDVVRAIVTADSILYPDDEAHLRGRLVEALRQRGIYPNDVRSLADAALAWPKAAPGLTLADPDAPFDLTGLIVTATMNQDTAGRLGPDEEAAAGLDGKALYVQASLWAKRHALELGFDPAQKISLDGIHVAYRMAQDRQYRPEIVIQLGQRRADLEDQALKQNRRTPWRAATTVIASADGTVSYVIPKPLPFTDETVAALGADHPALTFHEDGQVRAAEMRAWFKGLDEADPLGVWSPEPATMRLGFAALEAADVFASESATTVVIS